MRTTRRAASALAVVLLVGCGGGEGGEPERQPQTERARAAEKVDKREFVKRVDGACRQAARRWSDPLAVARELPPSPIQTTAPRRDQRAADTLRGYRALLQEVIDAVRGKPRPSEDEPLRKQFEIALSHAVTEMEGDELKLRQGWDRAPQTAEIRRLLRRARKLARRYGLDDCASMRTAPF